MKISETCSCGATIALTDNNAMRYVREWRRDHKHETATETGDTTFTTAESRAETTIGFQIDGLTNEPRKSGQPYWGDDEDKRVQ